MRFALVAAVAFAMAACGAEPRAQAPEIRTPQAAATVVHTAPAAAHPDKARRPAVPVRVLIPSIGVNAPVVKLGLDRHGALEAPKGFAETGWWSGGARPGERGPAVIAGHVDSKTGPAVFYKLGRLRPGARVTVRLRDGRNVRFRVQRVRHYRKNRFPTKQVYGATRRPTLRLITCSGTFDRASGHYLDNTVVYATT